VEEESVKPVRERMEDYKGMREGGERKRERGERKRIIKRERRREGRGVRRGEVRRGKEGREGLLVLLPRMQSRLVFNPSLILEFYFFNKR
jgi:hypothetical protein